MDIPDRVRPLSIEGKATIQLSRQPHRSTDFWMHPPYLNLLSLGSCIKEIPYLGTGIARADGQINHGFKNLIDRPDLIDAIPELNADRSMKSLVCALNTGSRFFTTGCFSREITDKLGSRCQGYLEFSWNCQVCVRDAINYFSLFFHFQQFLYTNQFDRQVKFQWSLEQTHFLDLDLLGFCCAISIETGACASKDRASEIWQVSLSALETFLNSVPGESAQVIY